MKQLHLRAFVAVLAAAALISAPGGVGLAWAAGAAALAAVSLGAAYVFWCSLPERAIALSPYPAGRFGPVWLLAAAAIFALAFLASFPDLDLEAARLFQSSQSRFVARTKLGEFGRMVGYLVPFLTLAAFLIAYGGRRWLGWRLRFQPSGRDVLFVGLAMLIGPALIVNLGMKDHLHRPRPSQIVEFGGGREYRPFYRFDGSCPKNCSFPSGEASEAFWMLAPASLTPPPWRGAAMVGAVAFGATVSLLRMAFGGHFLSDVVVAALIMWGLLMALRRLHYPNDEPALSHK